MSFSKKLGECLCMRCGHWWKPKPNADGEYSEPKACAGCKSKVWNQPRKYNLGTVESALIVNHREKPTGRAAAKLRKVKDKIVEVEFKSFTDYETLIISDQKKLQIELRLATENNLWYIGHRISTNTYGSSCGVVRSKYRTDYQSRDEAIQSELNDIKQHHSCYPEIQKAVQKFLDEWQSVASAFAQFRPTLVNLRKKGFNSTCHDWLRSRWSDFVGINGNETKEEWKRKHDLELIFPKVWEMYKKEFINAK